MVAGITGVVATVASAGVLAPITIPIVGGVTTAVGTGAAVVTGTAGVVASTTVVTGTGIGVGSLATTAAILSGPVGWAVLGVTEEQASALYTFDCWKPVLHDQSTEPSNGRILREVAADPRIKEITIAPNNSNVDLPHLILKNIRDEEFRIDYVYLSSIGLAAHAVRI